MDLFDLYQRTKNANNIIKKDVENSIDSKQDLMSLFATYGGVKEEGVSANANAVFKDGKMLRTTAGVAPEILEKVNEREENRQLAQQAYQELVDKYGENIDDIPELKIQKEALETIIKNPDLEPDQNYMHSLNNLINMAVGGSSVEELAKEGLVTGNQEAFEQGKGFFDYKLGENTQMAEMQKAEPATDTGGIISGLRQGANEFADAMLAPFRENKQDEKNERIETQRMHQASMPVKFIQEKSEDYMKKYGYIGGVAHMVEDLYKDYGIKGIVRVGGETIAQSLPIMIGALALLATASAPEVGISLLGASGLGDYFAGKSRQIYNDQKEKDWSKAITGGIASGALDIAGAETLGFGLTRKLFGKIAGKQIAKKLGEEGLAKAGAMYAAGVLADTGLEITTENLQNFFEEYGRTGDINKAIEEMKKQAVGTTVQTGIMSAPIATVSPHGVKKFHEAKQEVVDEAKKDEEARRIEEYKKFVDGIEPPSSLEEIKNAEKKTAPVIQYLRANPEGKEEALSYYENFLREQGFKEDEIEKQIQNVLEAAEKLGKIEKKSKENVNEDLEIPETDEPSENQIDLNDLEERLKSDTGTIKTEELEHVMKFIDEGKYSPEEVVHKIENEADREAFKEIYQIEPLTKSGSVSTNEVAQNIRNDLIRRWNKFRTAQNIEDKARRLFDVAFRMPTIAFKKIDPKYVNEEELSKIKDIIKQSNNAEEARALLDKENISNPVARNIAIELATEKRVRDLMLNELKKEKEKGNIEISDDDIVNIKKSSNKIIEHIAENLNNPIKSEHTDFENHTREILAKIYKEKKDELGSGIAKVAKLAKLKGERRNIDKEIQDIENDIKILKQAGLINEAKKLELKRAFLIKQKEAIKKKTDEKDSKLENELKKLKDIEKALKYGESKKAIQQKIKAIESKLGIIKENIESNKVSDNAEPTKKYRLKSGYIIEVNGNKVVLNIDGEKINLHDTKNLAEKKDKLEKAGLIKKINEEEEHIYTITKGGLKRKAIAIKNNKVIPIEKSKEIATKEVEDIDTKEIKVRNDEINALEKAWGLTPKIKKEKNKFFIRFNTIEQKLKNGKSFFIQNPVADILAIKNKNGESAVKGLNKVLVDTMALAYKKIATFMPDEAKLKELFEGDTNAIIKAITEYGTPLFVIKEELKNMIGKLKLDNGMTVFELANKLQSKEDYVDDMLTQHLAAIGIKMLLHRGFIEENKIKINGKIQLFYKIKQNSSQLLNRTAEIFDELKIEKEIREPSAPGAGKASRKIEDGYVEKGTAQEVIFNGIKNLSRVKFKFNDELGSQHNKYAKRFFDVFTDKDIADLFVDEAPTLTAKENKEIAKENIKRMYQNIKNIYSKQSEMSFDWKIYSNWRAGITSNTINYQLEKISRGLVSPEKSITVIYGTTAEEIKKNTKKFLFDENGEIKDFILKLWAFNLGIKVDRLDNDMIKEEFNKMFNITKDGIEPRKGVKRAFRFAKNAFVLGKEKWETKSDDKKALKKFAKEHEKVMTITTLRDIALIDAALKGKVEPYKVKGNIALYAKMEIDASTSATVLSRMLNGSVYARTKDILRASGVVLDAKDIASAFHGSSLVMKGMKEIADVYIVAKEKLLQKMKKPETIQEQFVYKEIELMDRNDFKKPIQQIEYSAGYKAFARGLAARAFENIEKRIGDAKNEEDVLYILKNLAKVFPNGEIKYGQTHIKKLKDINSLEGISKENISIERLYGHISETFVKNITEKAFDEFVKDIMPNRAVYEKMLKIIGKIIDKKKKVEPETKTIKELLKKAREKIGAIGFYNLRIYPFEIDGKRIENYSLLLPTKEKTESKYTQKTVPYIKQRVSKLAASMTHSIDAIIFFKALEDTKAYDKIQYIYDAAIIGYDEELAKDLSMAYNKHMIEETARNSHIVEFAKYILKNKDLISKKDLETVAKALEWGKKAKKKLFEHIDAIQNFAYSPLGKNDELIAYKPENKDELIKIIEKTHDDIINQINEIKEKIEDNPNIYDVRSKSIEIGENIRKTLLGKETLDSNGLSKYLRQIVNEKDEYTNHLIDIVETLEENLLGNEVIKLIKYKGDRFSLGSIQKQGDAYTIEVVLSDKDVVTSDIEIFVHELLHIIIDNTLPLSNEYKLKIKKVINTTIKALQNKYGKGNEWKAFLPRHYNEDDVEIAKAIAAYALFGEGTTKHENEFLIYALTNKNFIENLKDIDIDLRIFKKDISNSYLDDLINIIKELLNKLIGLVRRNNMKANEYVIKLYNELADAYYRIGNGASQRYAFMPKAARIVAKIDNITSMMKKESDKYIKPLINLANRLAIEPSIKVMGNIWRSTEIYRDIIDNEQARAFFQIFKLKKDITERDFYRIKSIAQASKESAKEKVDAVYGTSLKKLLKDFTLKEREELNTIIASSGLYGIELKDKDKMIEFIQNRKDEIKKLESIIDDRGVMAQINGLVVLKTEGKVINHKQMLNAYNIGMQFFRDKKRSKIPEEIIYRLITLKILDRVNGIDEIINKNPDAIHKVYMFYRNMEKIFRKKNDVSKIHEIHGYIKIKPRPFEELMWVKTDEIPKNSQIIKRGAKVKSESYVYVKTKDYSKSYIQGALGIKNLSHMGTTFYADEIVSERDHKEDNEYALVPILNNNGNIVGWRFNTITKPKGDIADNLAYTIADMFLREKTDEYNKKIIDLLMRDYLINDGKRKFVEISPKSEKYSKFWMMIPKQTRYYIAKKYGEKRLFVRPELIYDIFGYQEPYIFKNNSKLLWLEKAIKDIIEMAKMRMTILNVDTIMSNAKSNYDTLIKYGIDPVDAARRMKEAWFLAEQYEEDYLETLKMYFDMASGKPINLKEYRYRLKSKEENPISVVFKEGMMTPVIDDINVIEADNKNEIRRIIEDKFVSKLNEKMKKVVKSAYPTEETQALKIGMKLFQRGDLIAKYALYTWLREQGVPYREAIETADEAFVNYSITEHPILKYVSDIGVLIFNKYLFLAWKGMAKMLKLAPGRFVGTEAIQGFEKGYEESTDLYLHKSLHDIVEPRILSPLEGAKTILQPIFMQ